LSLEAAIQQRARIVRGVRLNAGYLPAVLRAKEVTAVILPLQHLPGALHVPVETAVPVTRWLGILWYDNFISIQHIWVQIA